MKKRISKKIESEEIPLIVEYLNRIQKCFVSKVDSAAFKYLYQTRDGLKTAFKRPAIAGFPDIVGISKEGKFLAIEVKSCKTDKYEGLRDAQKRFAIEILERDGWFFLADKGFDAFKEAFENWLKKRPNFANFKSFAQENFGWLWV